MRHYRLPLAFALLSAPLLAQNMGFYAMVPVVRDQPYIAERVYEMRSPSPSGSETVEKIRSTMMRDSSGRLREQTEGTQPDQEGSFREPWVRVLDPVSMLQTDLDVSHKTYHQAPIPEQVKLARSRPDFCTGPLSHPNPNGSITHYRYEQLGRATVQGVAADGCHITADDATPGFSYVTEFWRSPELQINLSSDTRYDNGREDSDRVVSLRLAEPEEALFRLPTDYTDMSAPPKRTNFNPNLDLLAEYGSIEWHEGTATLEAGGSDAANQVATTLKDCLGLAVSSERPFQMYIGDLLDTTDPKWAAQQPDPSKHVYAGKPAKVRVEFKTQKDGKATDPATLLRAVTSELNAQQPYEVAIDTVVRPHFTMYALVPHATHNEKGQVVYPQPYMDTAISLSEQRTTIANLATQLANQMTQKTGYKFSCCQAAVFGQPWGMTELQYQTSDKPAREVLADLMEAAGGTEAYSAACEARSHEFCAINVAAVQASPKRAGVCKIPGYDPTK